MFRCNTSYDCNNAGTCIYHKCFCDFNYIGPNCEIVDTDA